MGLRVEIEKNYGAFCLEAAFTAEEGVTGLLGASGCGKSVTLRCIAGVERPDRGYIELDGRVLFDSVKKINLPPQRRRVGYLFQNYALFPTMTVEQNIAAGVRDRNERREETERLMASFQLEECRGKYPRQISGGQQQRTALARILASRPEALLLDEPFSALDSYLKWQVELELLERLSQFSGPVLFVTHSRDEICSQCRRVCVLDRGKSQPVQTVEELFSAPATLSACRLSGCENLSRARMLGNGRVEAEDWGVVLTPAAPPPERISHVGIRARSLRTVPGPGINRLLCRVVRRVKGVSGVTLLLTPVTGGGVLRMEWGENTSAMAERGEELWVELPPQALMSLSGT